MADEFTELEALREATRPRLNASTTRKLRDHVQFLEIGDRQLAIGLTLLLDMHDRLEALRHGQA